MLKLKWLGAFLSLRVNLTFKCQFEKENTLWDTPFLSLVLKLLASFMSRHHGWLKQKVSFQACQRAKIVSYIPLYFTHHIANSLVVSYWVSILWNVICYNWKIWKRIQQGIVWEKRNLKVINLHQLPIYFLCKNLRIFCCNFCKRK
jgi:hypothetical protein